MTKSEKISLLAASIVGINAMIGAGVFAIPALLANQAGPASIFTALIIIFFVMCIGLSLGRCAEIYPGGGWNYLYPAKWAGHLVGMLSSFLYLFGVVIGMGFLVQQLGVWFNGIFPFLHPNAIGIIVLLCLMGLVLAGAKTSSWAQYAIAVLVVTPLLVATIFGFLNLDYKVLTPFIPFGTISIFKAIPTVLFILLGFESIISLYGIMHNPKKNVPLAFIISISVVGLIYTLFVAAILFSVPIKFFSAGVNETLSSVLLKVYPSAKFLSPIIFVGAVFGIIGTLHSMLWSLSELFTSLLDRTKSKFVHMLLRKNIWNDRVSVVVITALMIGAAFCGDLLVPLTSVFMIPSYIVSIFALLLVKKEWISGRNIITLFGVFGSGLMFYFAYIGSIPKILSYFF